MIRIASQKFSLPGCLLAISLAAWAQQKPATLKPAKGINPATRVQQMQQARRQRLAEEKAKVQQREQQRRRRLTISKGDILAQKLNSQAAIEQQDMQDVLQLQQQLQQALAQSQNPPHLKLLLARMANAMGQLILQNANQLQLFKGLQETLNQEQSFLP